MTRQLEPRVYALVAAAMFCAFATAVMLNPTTASWLGAGVAAVLFTSVAYGYLEYTDDDVEEMFE